MGFIDFRLGLNGVSWELLHKLEGDPDFASWNDVEKVYDMGCETSTFYNGRERGFCLRVHYRHLDPSGRILNVCFAESRSSDSIVVYSWIGHVTINPPTLSDVPKGTSSNAKYFSTTELASDHITELMKNFLEEEKRNRVVQMVLSL